MIKLNEKLFNKKIIELIVNNVEKFCNVDYSLLSHYSIAPRRWHIKFLVTFEQQIKQLGNVEYSLQYYIT